MSEVGRSLPAAPALPRCRCPPAPVTATHTTESHHASSSTHPPTPTNPNLRAHVVFDEPELDAGGGALDGGQDHDLLEPLIPVRQAGWGGVGEGSRTSGGAAVRAGQCAGGEHLADCCIALCPACSTASMQHAACSSTRPWSVSAQRLDTQRPSCSPGDGWRGLTCGRTLR